MLTPLLAQGNQRYYSDTCRVHGNTPFLGPITAPGKDNTSHRRLRAYYPNYLDNVKPNLYIADCEIPFDNVKPQHYISFVPIITFGG